MIAAPASASVNITATDPNAAEQGQDPGVFTVTRSGGDQTSPLVVYYTVDPSSTASIADYQPLTGYVVILANQTSATIAVTPIDDAIVEPTETLTLAVDADPYYYSAGALPSATVYIADNDVPPTVTINQAAAQADPANGSPINFTVVFSVAVTDFVTGDVSLGGTAGATTATVSGNGTTYNVAVSGMTRDGTIIASLAAGAAHDAAGNACLASTSTDNTVTYDVTAPTASVTTAPPTINAAGSSTTTLTVTYFDGGAGIDTSTFSTLNLSVTNGATVATVTAVSHSGNAVTYTITAPSGTWGASPQGTYTVGWSAIKSRIWRATPWLPAPVWPRSS